MVEVQRKIDAGLNERSDPNILQRAASNPHDSIWVSASAGTGKTKVLTDRVLRLLLPRSDGQEGTKASRILCLTFTKSAANEMALRVHETLGSWAVMDVDHAAAKKSLRTVLADLLGDEPTARQIESAQRLFAHVIDCPGGLKIMTIHSFCRSVLGRFPVEAGISPNFGDLDDAASGALIQAAQMAVLKDAQRDDNKGSPLHEAVDMLAGDLDEDSFARVIRDVCGERYQMEFWAAKHGGAQGLYANICAHYDIEQSLCGDSVLAALCGDGAYDEPSLRRVAAAMLDGGKQEAKSASLILNWLNSDEIARNQLFGAYKGAYLTGKGMMRAAKGFPTKKTLEIAADARDVLEAEGERILSAVETLKRIKSARMTRAALVIGQAVLARYTALKRAQGALDFDDLILHTVALLTGETAKFSALNEADSQKIPNWIMYKMDQGLDHILVDEAQDTNPEQWRIIEALGEDFFNGMSARGDVERTSFTVGDIKQSIYSFQRAAPEEFKRMEGVLDFRIKNAGLVNRRVDLDISFRSTESVLRIVDSIFADAELNRAVGGGVIRHESFRIGQEGRVELWPCFEDPKNEPRDFWNVPSEITEYQSGASQLAEYIADNIRNMVNRKETLGAYGRNVQAGDIMILVRSRSAFVEQMMRALKRRGVPVSGADRMILGEQIAVQDLLAVARFCLCPSDDLTLAEILKSPLIGWDEEELFSVSYGRKGSLWQEVCNFDRSRIDSIMGLDEPVPCVSGEKREKVRDYLGRLIGRVGYMGAHEFLSHILTQGCPADSQSGLRAMRGRLGDDSLDSIDELMNAALSFGRDAVDHVQLFLEHQEQAQTQIKREMEERGGMVRIMTIHGSKGLQAPIVIMPDTIPKASGKKGGRLLWPDKTKLDFPLYSPRGDDDPEEYKGVLQKCRDLDEEESARLLYVAMTRAADRLYVAGYKGSRSSKERSWYDMIKQAMEADAACEEVGEDVLRVSNVQNAVPDKVRDEQETLEQGESLPAWAFTAAPQPSFPPRPLMPSRPCEEDMEVALSPLKAMGDNRFRRGNITHKLLQFLPDFEDNMRRDAATKFVQQNARDVSGAVQEGIVAEVLDILEDPQFAPFFVQGSMAEVSVTGLMDDNRIISGQIDRLVVSDDEIWIVDYKTNRPPPRDPNDVPQIYHKQMAAYRDSLAKIYPNRKIHTALLWTDGPFLTVL